MSSAEYKDKRIAVVGVGGVGGYIAGLLVDAYSHVTLVARGGRGASIREKGLVLHSDYKGEYVVHPERVVESAEELGPQDFIFICVKNYSLEEVCKSLAGAVMEETVIVPVMNGVDPGERARAFLKKGTVVDSLIYIVAFANADYSVTQQDTFANLRIGIMDADDGEARAVRDAAGLLTGADIDYKVSDDIECEIWRKYILNCAYNVMTAYYNNTIGELRKDAVKAEEYEQLVYEAYRVGLAKGVHVCQEHVDEILHKFYKEHAEDATSSLQRDVWSGRSTEIETFSGYILKEGRLLGVDVPVSERMYEGLKGKITL